MPSRSESQCHNCPSPFMGANIRVDHGFPGVLTVPLTNSWPGVLLRFPLQGCHRWMLVRVGHCGVLWGRPAMSVVCLGVLGLIGQTVWGTSTTITERWPLIQEVGYGSFYQSKSCFFQISYGIMTSNSRHKFTHNWRSSRRSFWLIARYYL